MKVFIRNQNEKGKEFIEEIEINPKDVVAISNKETRLFSLGKGNMLLTLKSYKDLKKELIQNGTMQKIDLSRR